MMTKTMALYLYGSLYSFFGGSILFAVIYLFKVFGFNIKFFIIASPLILLNQYIFNYVYSSIYPSVIKGWMITTVVVSSVIFLYSTLFLNESFEAKHILAFCFILVGLYILK